MKRLLLRFLLAFGLLLALCYPIYLGVGNWLLRSGEIERRLNRRPERLRVTFTSAWTPWPGVVHFKGFEIRNQTRAVQWWLAIDSGVADIDLWKLYDREFGTDRIHGEGVAFRLRRRADAPILKTVTRRQLEPPIPGLSNPPRPAPEALYPRPQRRRQAPGTPTAPRREPWRLLLSGIELENVREIWIEEVRFSGEARVAGSFDLQFRRQFELMGARVEVASGSLDLGMKGGPNGPILSQMSGRVAGNIAAYPPAGNRGWDMLRFVSGRAELQGQVPSLDWLDIYLAKTRWIDFRGSAGPVSADLRMKRGDFLPGSRLEARPQSLAIAFLDYVAEGSGRALWDLVPGGKEPTARLALQLTDYGIRRGQKARPHVQGRGLKVDAVGSAPHLAKHDLFSPSRVAIEIPGAEVADLSFYNAYLPRGVNLAFTGGKGILNARFRAAGPDWKGSGDLRLKARGVGARFEAKRLRGDLSVHTLLREVDFQGKRFDVSGSDVELTDVVSLSGATPETNGKRWWARIHVDRAVLEPGSPVYAKAQIEGALSDPRPLLALFVPEQRKRVLRWVDKLFDIQGVGATADLKVGQRSIAIDDLAVVGGEAQLLGRLRLTGADKQGILYARYGRLDVGLALDGDKRDWKVLRPRKWFAEQGGFR